MRDLVISSKRLEKAYSYPTLFRIGKYSKIKNPKIWICPVKIAIPVNNKIIPEIFVTFEIYFLKLLEKRKNLLIKIPDIIKGIASPSE